MNVFNFNSFKDNEMRFSLTINYNDCPEWIKEEVYTTYKLNNFTDNNTEVSIIAHAHTYHGITLCTYELETTIYYEGSIDYTQLTELELDTDQITELWTAIREKYSAFLESLDLDSDQVLEFAETVPQKAAAADCHKL